MSDEVLVAVEATVATVTLNRPDKLNAVTPAMATAYAQTLRALDDDPDVRVVVVTGAGRGFCAGADLGQLDQGVEHLDRHFASPDAAPDTALRIRKPVVAAVNGPVAGLGFAYLLCCDLRGVATSATLRPSSPGSTTAGSPSRSKELVSPEGCRLGGQMVCVPDPRSSTSIGLSLPVPRYCVVFESQR